MAEKVYYCSTCQLGKEYEQINNKINSLTTCINNYEFITSDFYQKSYALLKEIRDFGSKDSNNPKLPNVDNFFTLAIQNLRNELITHNFYDDIINTINNNLNSNKKNEIIYGSYWTNLKTTLQNIKIPNTKYYEKNCCSCYGECGWYCGSYSSCSCCGTGSPFTCGECGSYGCG